MAEGRRGGGPGRGRGGGDMGARGAVVFVGNLPGDVREREVEDLFYKVRPPWGPASQPWGIPSQESFP